MSRTMYDILGQILAQLVAAPGQTAWKLAETLGLPKQHGEHARLADGTFCARKRHLGYDLVQRTLRAAERNGDVVSAKMNDGKRVWFLTPDVVAVAA